MRFAGDWEKYVKRQARWVDFQQLQESMDASYMESVMWAFKQLFDKGLVSRATASSLFLGDADLART